MARARAVLRSSCSHRGRRFRNAQGCKQAGAEIARVTTEANFNLPNAITAARIAVAPLIAWLPFSSSATLRFTGFALFIIAAVTDYFDGRLARSRNLVTDLGRILDPLADKLLLVATFVPMFLMMAPAGDFVAGTFGFTPESDRFSFVTPFGKVGFPWWVLAIILGREIFMTVFRQAAAARGVIISAIGPAKWKTGFQWTWVGAAYFWFFAVTLAEQKGWATNTWNIAANGIGIIGAVTMVVATLLTVYSLGLYLARYGKVFRP